MSNCVAQDRSTQISHYQSADQANVLTKIYQPECNLAVWQQSLSSQLQKQINDFLETAPDIDIVAQIAANNIAVEMKDALSRLHIDDEILVYITGIVDMFSCLFDLTVVGLRLKTLHSAMCPKFHVDKVPVRLVTTMAGLGSEWLDNNLVKRENNRLIIDSNVTVRSLECGDVALLKGERWAGNEGKGLVHRSPKTANHQKRLLLTLDFIA